MTQVGCTHPRVALCLVASRCGAEVDELMWGFRVLVVWETVAVGSGFLNL